MKKLVDTICENAPCVMCLMAGVSSLVASQAMAHTAPQVIELILGVVMIATAARFWGKV